MTIGDFACGGMLFHGSSENLKNTKIESFELFNTEVLLRKSKILVQAPVEGDACTVNDTNLNPSQVPDLICLHVEVFLIISPS